MPPSTERQRQAFGSTYGHLSADGERRRHDRDAMTRCSNRKCGQPMPDGDHGLVCPACRAEPPR